MEIKKYTKQNFQNPDKLINDVSVQNATLEMFSKYKQNELKKFIHVRISTEKSTRNKAPKKFGLKKTPNKGTMVAARLALDNNSLHTLVAFDFHLRNQEVIIKYNQLYTSINKIL